MEKSDNDIGKLLRQSGIFASHFGCDLSEVCFFETGMFDGCIEDFEIRVIRMVFDRDNVDHHVTVTPT
jgi:hypothetical protein